MLLTNTPAVSMQGTPGHPGSPGTCEAQAFGYDLGSYTASRSPDGTILWDAALPQNEVSAAYQFALAVEKGFASCPAGGLALEYLSRLIGFGSPSAADVPYKPDCAYFDNIDLATVYPNAGRLACRSAASRPFTSRPRSCGSVRSRDISPTVRRSRSPVGFCKTIRLTRRSTRRSSVSNQDHSQFGAWADAGRL